MPQLKLVTQTTAGTGYLSDGLTLAVTLWLTVTVTLQLTLAVPRMPQLQLVTVTSAGRQDRDGGAVKDWCGACSQQDGPAVIGAICLLSLKCENRRLQFALPLAANGRGSCDQCPRGKFDQGRSLHHQHAGSGCGCGLNDELNGKGVGRGGKAGGMGGGD